MGVTCVIKWKKMRKRCRSLVLQRGKCNGEGDGNKSYNDILTENLAENEVTRNGNGLSVVRNKRIREKKSE